MALAVVLWFGDIMSAVPLRNNKASATAVRSVSVLGATGSIGDSTMDLLRASPDRYRVEALTANSNAQIADSGGYFAGKGIGGPKLWPRVSPKKTWAGAVGGFAASLVVATGFVALGSGKVTPILLLGAMLSIASQLGDLFESAVKRRFGVKDSSQIIPGHGGLLDRLDGFVAAVVLAAILGFLRGGADGVGRGLMVW